MAKTNTRYPLIRTIYLYIFSLLGLTLITIGTVRFVNMGLKMFVFTQADEDQRYMYEPPMMPYSAPMMDRGGKRAPEQEQWTEEYKRWQEKRANVDRLAVRRHQDASINIALILVGLPLYLYHWRIIQKETKETV